MNKISVMLRSSLGRKLMMSLTGLFLILFLVVHLVGNLQLLAGDEGVAFNRYSHFMSNSLLIQTVSKLNFTFILLHVLYSIWLTRTNAAARPVGYAGKAVQAQSAWNSRNMGILGTLVLVFLIVHLKGFWYQLKFESPAYTTLPLPGGGSEVVVNAYEVVRVAYSEAWYVGVYLLGLLAVGIHLHHGFRSAFQTLGLGYSSYSQTIRSVGVAFAWIVPALFALIPVMMYFGLSF
ncbi:MAG: succinate dehydrogenase cytochrome b subunit [Bacteroidota bacterium]